MDGNLKKLFYQMIINNINILIINLNSIYKDSNQSINTLLKFIKFCCPFQIGVQGSFVFLSLLLYLDIEWIKVRM